MIALMLAAFLIFLVIGVPVAFALGLAAFTALGLTGADHPLPQVLRITGKGGKTRLVPLIDSVRQSVETGIPPAQVADQVFDAIRAEQFYILTHPETKLWVKRRADRIVQGRKPTEQ